MHKYMSIYKTTMLVPILRFKCVLCLRAALFFCCTAYGGIGSGFVIRGGLSISRFAYTFIFIFYVQGESTYTTKIDKWPVGCILLELTISSSSRLHRVSFGCSNSERAKQVPHTKNFVRVVPSRNFPRSWTWVWVRDGDEMMWRHIFVTFRHIPGSMRRYQVSKKLFLVLPKMWRFYWNLVWVWRFRHNVTSFFWFRLGTKHSLTTWPGPGFWVAGFPIEWVSFDFNVSYSSCWGYAGRRTDFRDKKSSDFSGEIFRERNFGRSITAPTTLFPLIGCGVDSFSPN